MLTWIEGSQTINYLAVAVATIASYVLGFAWFHWAVFGKAWAGALGITKEQADNTEGLGKVELADGTWHCGFMSEGNVVSDAINITEFGGWKGYLASKP